MNNLGINTIASFSIPSKVSKVSGSIENFQITAKGEKYHCCTWRIDESFSHDSEVRSSIFTVSNRSDCKWYLSLKTNYGEVDGVRIINCYLRLVLDRESECEEASAKFKLTILGRHEKHECNLDSSRTFKFVRKSENRAGISSVVEAKNIYRGLGFYGLRVACEMKIETAFPDVDSFSSDFGSLLKYQLFTDVVLSVGEKKFPAHKAILSARSSVFAAMFAHNMVENRGEVQIKDMAEDVVEEMLRFIYTGEVENLNELAADLLMAGDKYDLKGLRIKCEKAMVSTLSSSNVVDIMALAKLHNATELKIKAIEFVLKTGSEVRDTPAWKNLSESDFELVKEICEAFMKSKVVV